MCVCVYVWVACILHSPKTEMVKFKMKKRTSTKTVECEISISLLIVYSTEYRTHHVRTHFHLQILRINLFYAC